MYKLIKILTDGLLHRPDNSPHDGVHLCEETHYDLPVWQLNHRLARFEHLKRQARRGRSGLFVLHVVRAQLAGL